MVFGDGAERGSGGGLWYATLLFILLLVLPGAYLGYEQWRTMRDEREAALSALPTEVIGSADRLVLAIRARYEELLEAEMHRPFWHYRKEYHPISTQGKDLALVPSPLLTEPLHAGVEAHFAYTMDEGRDAMVHLFLGSDIEPEMYDSMEEDLTRVAEELVGRDYDEGSLFSSEALTDVNWSAVIAPLVAAALDGRSEKIPLPHAAVNLSRETDIDCLRDSLPALTDLQELEVTTLTTSFRVRSLFDRDNTPRLVATRRVFVDSPKGLAGALPDCFQEASYGTTLVQGFFLDRAWLLEKLPARTASTTIPAHLEFSRAPCRPTEPEPASASLVEVSRSLFEELEIETYGAATDAREDKLFISSDIADVEAVYDRRWQQFLATFAILSGALGTGLFLLLRSVRSSVRDASRTRNFVAAVSHELKTPVAALRLYGEMLSEGWAKDEEKRAEYHQRIVRESERLELLVDRVMQKTRLESTTVDPVEIDLGALVTELVARLAAGRDDVQLEIKPGLSRALADPEGVRSILENLVENARKYAKCTAARPVEVTLEMIGGRPALIVSDKGPGVPSEERSQIFDAFYRTGDEERRAAKGIGLGLHLSALHASAMGAELKVTDRQGGGASFILRFRTGDGATPR